MKQRLQEIAAELLKISNEIENTPQVEAEEPVRFLSDEFEYIEIRRDSDSKPVAIITRSDIEVTKAYKAKCKPI